jgi:hypothetical protein
MQSSSDHPEPSQSYQTDDDSPLDIIYETTKRSYDKLFQASESLDSKAGSIFNVGAVVAGLFLTVGVLSISAGEEIMPRIPWLPALITGIGLIFCALTMLLSLKAWMSSEIELISPGSFVAAYERKSEIETKKFLVMELADEFDINFRRREKLAQLTKSAQRSLVFAVDTMLAFITVIVVSQLY